MSKIEYKRKEDVIMGKIMDYINSTYDGHYAAAGGRQVFEDWEDMNIAKEAYISNCVKYVKRFGKKEGENPKDIIKNIHYSIFLLYEIGFGDEE